jgi:undecaprenyl diphosphate synthase
MLWEAAYSELAFVPQHWPDFDEQALDAVLADYAQRQRRFGK